MLNLILANEKKDRRDRKTMKAMMLEAGFYESTANQQQKTLQALPHKPESQSILQQLKKERQALLLAMPKKRKDAKYRDIIDGVDKITKVIELLSGRPTSREDTIFNPEQINAIFNRRTKKDSTNRKIQPN